MEQPNKATMPASSADECSVCVAVKIRPLVPSEQEQGCRTSFTVPVGRPVVQALHHQFTYDHVFGGDAGTEPDLLYPKCVAPLVEGLFKGYNATVFAYGQTGSGKTYTMGSEYRPGGKAQGVIPEAINAIFTNIEANKEYECSVRVSFVEIHKEEIRDLLVTSPAQRSAISIRESSAGGVSLYGAVELDVRSVDQMARILEAGSLARATASTSMNSKSSRSHAIYTITVEQRRQVACAPMPTSSGADDDEDAEEDTGAMAEDPLDDYLCAKLHLVDLAGSERAKRTKAEKDRLKEGIHINRGLLALGNVISALVDKKSHVPYRDSKLTRLLQDSLGGNSRTVMIACISPADINLEEGLNTLRYADRARHIRNKPTVNRDPVTAQLAALRQQVARLEAENSTLKRAAAAQGKDPLGDLPEERSWQMVEELQTVVEQLQLDNRSLELENAKLKVQLVQSHKALQQLKGGRRRTSQGGVDAPSALSTPLPHGPSASGTPLPMTGGGMAPGSATAAGDAWHAETPAPRQEMPMTPAPPQSNDHAMHDGDEEADVDEQCFYAEMAAHSLEQEKMKQDMAVLQRMLEQKERKMQELMRNSGQVPALKQHYDRVLQELEKERDNLQNEKVAMMQKLQQLHAASEEERKRLETYYKDRITQYDEKLREVRRKEREFMTMQKLKLRTDEMCNRLNADIQRIKQQKVALMKNMETSARQFAQWKADREKEVVQLRRQNRRNVVHIQHLEALQAKQNAVLQRKISDANAARKKLKELQSLSTRDPGRGAVGSSMTSLPTGAAGGVVEVQPNAQAPLLRTEKARREWLEKELDLCNQSFEYQRVLDGELAQRAETSRQLREIEKRLMVLEHLVPASPLVTDGSIPLPLHDNKERLVQRKDFLQQQLAHHNAQIIDLQAAWEQAKLEEEGKGGGAADAKRWTGVRNIIESRELMRSLFKVACDHKSQAKDVQMDLVKSQEELDLIRVQLDAARKEAEAQRKRAAAIEATAATAMTTPFAAESAAHDDDVDAEVDDLLHQLQVVASTPVRQMSAAKSLKASLDVTRLHEAAGLDGTIQVQIQDPGWAPGGQGKAADRYSAGLSLSLDVAGQGDGASVVIGSDSDSDIDMEEAPGARRGAADMAVDDSGEDEGDDDDDASDEEDQDEWDPINATPAKQRRRQSSRRTSGEPESRARRRASGAVPPSSESAILEHVNKQLTMQGKAAVQRLTCDALRKELVGKTINGKVWAAGRKNKEQLLQDYCALLGLPAGTDPQQGRQQQPAQGQGQGQQGARQPPGQGQGQGQGAKAGAGLQSPSRWGSGSNLHAIDLTRSPSSPAPLYRGSVIAAVQQLTLQSQGSVGSGQWGAPGAGAGAAATASPSRGRPPLSPMMTSPMAISPAPWSRSPPRGAPGQACETPISPSAAWAEQSSNGAAAAAGGGLNPFASASAASPLRLMRAASAGHGGAGTGIPQLQLSVGNSPRAGAAWGGLATPLHIPDSPMSDLSLNEPSREHNLTPLSLLYIQKAQEARERTAQLRQSIQKGAAGYEAAAAARAATQGDVPPLSKLGTVGSGSVQAPGSGGVNAGVGANGGSSSRGWSPVTANEGKVSPRLSPGQAVSPNSKAPAAAVAAAALVNGASPRIWR